MVARGNPRSEAHDAKHNAVVEGGADLAPRFIVGAVVVDREAFARPDHGRVGTGSPGSDVLHHFIDLHRGLAVLVMAGDDAADGQAHWILPDWVCELVCLERGDLSQ